MKFTYLYALLCIMLSVGFFVECRHGGRRGGWHGARSRHATYGRHYGYRGFYGRGYGWGPRLYVGFGGYDPYYDYGFGYGYGCGYDGCCNGCGDY